MNDQVQVPIEDAIRIIDEAIAKAPLSRGEHVVAQQMLGAIAQRLEEFDKLEKELLKKEQEDGDQS